MLKRCVLAIAIIAAILAPAPGFAQVSVADRLAAGQPPVIVAHRARGGLFPENSLSGIRHAIDIGIDMVQISVQVTLDGRHVLMHDADLNRTTDVEAVFPDGSAHRAVARGNPRRDFVRDYTLAEIRRLRLRNGQDGGDHPVPTLDEALALIDGRMLVILALKKYDLGGLMAVLATHGTENLLLFDAAYPPELDKAVRAAGIRTYASLTESHDYLSGLEWLAEYAGPALAMVGVYRDRLTPEFVARADALGIRFSIFGLHKEDPLLLRGDASAWQAARDSGAAAFLTGHPGLLQDALGL